MDFSKQIFDQWAVSAHKLNGNKWFQRMATGDLNVAHYASLLRQTYHHAKWNPQIQACATLWFKDNPHDVVKKFFQHAISEIGHDLLALNDLKALGQNVSGIEFEEPLPATRALIAFPIFEMQWRSPLVYLGYLYHLEYLPTQSGRSYVEMLTKIGVPKEALTFIEEHSVADIHHNKMMEFYISKLVKTESDARIVISAAQATCKLHEHMMCDAFEAAE